MKTRSNIVLIGMPGVGKSVLGRALAQRTGRAFIDVDEIIEEKMGLKLQQIIDRFGNNRFVEIEEEAILGLGERKQCVISPGGSVVYSTKAMDFLSGHAVVVFLKASLDGIRKNITNREVRGIVGLKGRDLKTLFKERTALYERYADMTVEIPAEFEIDLVIEEIMRNLSDMSE